MVTPTDTIALAREPQQARSRERFEAIVAEADALLAEAGLSGFSIPTLAERLGYARRSIYMFFPTPYAVLNTLTKRYAQQLECEINAFLERLTPKDIETLAVRTVFFAADFHNRHPVARLLILGGAVTDMSFKSQEILIKHLGRLTQRLLTANGIDLPEGPVDIAAAAVEVATGCFRLSYAQFGEITEEYKIEAALVMLRYGAEFFPSAGRIDRADIRRLAGLEAAAAA